MFGKGQQPTTIDANRIVDEHLNSKTGEVNYIFKIGKYKGDYVSAVAEDDSSYLQWMLDNIDDIPDDVAEIIQGAIDGTC